MGLTPHELAKLFVPSLYGDLQPCVKAQINEALEAQEIRLQIERWEAEAEIRAKASASNSAWLEKEAEWKRVATRRDEEHSAKLKKMVVEKSTALAEVREGAQVMLRETKTKMDNDQKTAVLKLEQGFQATKTKMAAEMEVEYKKLLPLAAKAAEDARNLCKIYSTAPRLDEIRKRNAAEEQLIADNVEVARRFLSGLSDFRQEVAQLQSHFAALWSLQDKLRSLAAEIGGPIADLQAKRRALANTILSRIDKCRGAQTRTAEFSGHLRELEKIACGQGSGPVPSLLSSARESTFEETLASLIGERLKVVRLKEERCFAVDAAQKQLMKTLDLDLATTRANLEQLPAEYCLFILKVQEYVAPLPWNEAKQAVHTHVARFASHLLLEFDDWQSTFATLCDCREYAQLIVTQQETFTSTFGALLASPPLPSTDSIKSDLAACKQVLDLKRENPAFVAECGKEIEDLEGQLRQIMEKTCKMNEQLSYLRAQHDLFPEFALNRLHPHHKRKVDEFLGNLVENPAFVFRKLSEYSDLERVTDRCKKGVLNGKPCFLKLHKLDDPNVVKVVRRELRVKDRVRCPHVLSPDSMFVDLDASCIVFHFPRLLGSLSELATQLPTSMTSKLDFTWLVNSSLDLCSALSALHNYRIVHGDISPGNILVDQQAVLHLADFAESVSSESVSLDRGTLEFMAPERIANFVAANPQSPRNATTPESDFFSLGKCLAVLAEHCKTVAPQSERTSPLFTSFIQAVRTHLLNENDAKQRSLELFMKAARDMRGKETEDSRALAATKQRDLEKSERRLVKLQTEVDAVERRVATVEAECSLPNYWITKDINARSTRSSPPRTLYVRQQLLNLSGQLPEGRQLTIRGDVVRNENTVLWRAFRANSLLIRRQMEEARLTASSLPPPMPGATHLPQHLSIEDDVLGVGEVYLFHGTATLETAEKILSMGFDPTMSSKGLLGTGTYFTPNILKALKYGKVVIISRVAIGAAHDYGLCLSRTGLSDLRRPPNGANTVFGVPLDDQEVVTYTNNRAYPEFLFVIS